MARAYVSVGSNIDREHHVRGAIATLRDRYGPLLISPVYETPAEGFDGEPFYNLVVAFETDEPPGPIAEALAAIEHAHGRERRADRLHSRTLDLDLLLYDDRIVDEPGLKLPREDIARYAFVLKPLADIAPDDRHPQTGRSFADMWRDFRGDRRLEPVALDLEAG